MVDSRSLPEYDLSCIPDDFKRLRASADSGPKEWVEAFSGLIGAEGVHNDGDMYLIVFNGMGYKFQQSMKRKGFLGSHKKYLLNVLSHMHVFGAPRVK
eukprot:CAMPEP_0177154510 /NCGR_PEP_ID=MMETSP0367-20130122/1670_1 /TAXON_ID=447022 ORGANISM="Scrippsiella hangoei-like, Strain SHHI-4" /NCGR_SAMPLE_ID=MMETSP0367 /ASSEMBLY_ACC=CAM_ASM_000362 /LENGTH=97 /DNA_ID=CAMNT_0018599779 /DNA_START=173 /DNA_END=466 /DNA_ORIENTATION=+